MGKFVQVWRDELDKLLVREPLSQRMAMIYNEGSKHFLPVWFGAPREDTGAATFILSIQASSTHYCSPRETHPFSAAYTAFEIYLNEAALAEMPNWKVWAELEQYQDGSSSPVFGYVPRALVLKVVEALEGVVMGKAYPVHAPDGW